MTLKGVSKKSKKEVIMELPEPRSFSTDVIKRFLAPKEYEKFTFRYRQHVLDYRRDRLLSLAQSIDEKQIELLEDYFAGVPIKALSEKFSFYKGSCRYIVGYIALKWVFQHRREVLKIMKEECPNRKEIDKEYEKTKVVYQRQKHTKPELRSV